MRNPDILTHSNAQTMYVPINFEGYYEKIMRAGSPISMKGKLANDNTAMGILLDDVTREYPMGEIVILGFVDYEIAQNASGITLTPEAKAAMKNITFVGDPESGSSGGVSPEEVTTIVKENFPGGVGYEELTETTIFDGTVTNDTMLSETNFIEVGKEYTVIWDGATYNCTAFVYEEWDGAAMIGSPSGDYSEYPFCIYNDLEIYIECADNKEHTLSISTLSKVAHKIDAKFLPDGLVTENVLNTKLGDLETILDSINGEVI